jgi:hypothetical protein
MIGTVLVISILSGLPAVTSSSSVLAQQDTDVAPAPPSIGADVPLTYFGPAPSEVNPSFIGPLQLLRSGPVDLNESTVTLPLYKGQLVTGARLTSKILLKNIVVVCYKPKANCYRLILFVFLYRNICRTRLPNSEH